jgi:glycosyltransferase involved in cell wall biosynthesis
VALVNATSLLRRSRADFVLIEEEPFSLSAMYWSRAARALRLPYAVQVAENLDRHLPYMLRRARMKVLGGASVVLARSPSALERAQQWGFHGEGVVLGHGIESTVSSSDVRPGSTVGFVGRLVEAKGVDDLIAALNAHPELRLRVAGDGALRDRFAQLADRVEMLGTLAPEALDDFYRSLDVVAVPSRTTPTWSEQFGRVLVEAQGCATAVVAYDSGEIPWVASLSSVVLVHEGDVETLGRVLSEIASDPQRARQLGESGRAQVEKHFTNAALAQQLAPLITAALRAK